MKHWLSLLAALLLSGCANFAAVSEFGSGTVKLTKAVRGELQQVSKMCLEQAEIRIVVTGSPTDQPLEDCKRKEAALVEFQKVTLDTLELYGTTLGAMAEDKAFDLSNSISATGDKLAKLKDKDGAKVLNEAKVGAVAKVISLLADVVVQRKREEGIRRLVAVGPDLQASGEVLREFFDGKTLGYGALLQEINTLSDQSLNRVTSPLARNAEPFRSKELERQITRSQGAIKKRQGLADSSVPGQLLKSLNAWIEAIPEFQRDALKTEPQDLWKRLKTLRKRIGEASDAVENAF